MFDVNVFLAPLSGSTLLFAFLLGFIVGLAMWSMKYHLGRIQIIWQVIGGIIFFVLMALNRFLEGSHLWERFLAVLVLWVLYTAGIFVAGYTMKKGALKNRL